MTTIVPCAQRIAAILLAAGESSRMGVPKPLLPWQGTTLVAYQVVQLKNAGVDPLVVVVGHQAERVLDALAGFYGIMVRVNPDYQLGKSTSIRTAAECLPSDAAAVIIQAVDQPRTSLMLRRLISAHFESGQHISVPVHLGRRGHPPILSSMVMPELASVDEETMGLRAVMKRHAGRTNEVVFDGADVLLNLNTPEEYRRALADVSAAE